MVQNNQLDEKTIDALVVIFKKAVSQITSTIKENKIIENIQAVDSFNKQKQKQAKEDEATLQELDSKLKNL
jgi:hypothetical protein